jgi:hypothetical protein
MKKNVIRITESELKNYIRKIVSEQTAPAATTPSLDAITKELQGKTVNLFTDAGKTKKQTQFRMDSFEIDTVRGLPRLKIVGTDYNHFNEFNQKITAPNTMRIMDIYISCSGSAIGTTPMDTKGNQAEYSRSTSLYNDALVGKVKSLLNCAAMERRGEVDFVASAKSNKPADFA